MKRNCKNCKRFFKSVRKTNEYCSKSCAVSYRKNNPSPEEIALALKKKEDIRRYRLNYRLRKKMEDYWHNYKNGDFTGKQKGQVAPILSYLPRHTFTLFGKLKFRKLEDMVQSPEDLAWKKDYEGLMLGKYDF